MDLSPADGTGARRAGLLVTFAGSSARALDCLTVWLPDGRQCATERVVTRDLSQRMEGERTRALLVSLSRLAGSSISCSTVRFVGSRERKGQVDV